MNAFNLWAIRGSFWQPDTTPIDAFGSFSLGPQYVWGIVLVAAAVALVVWRYVQDRTPRALLEGCAIATLAFFVLATRMHERYLFNGLLFTIVCIPFARRYLWGAVALTVVLFANLDYSLQYLYVMDNHVRRGQRAKSVGSGDVALRADCRAERSFGWAISSSAEMQARRSPSRRRVFHRQPVRAVAVGDGGVERYPDWFDPREGLTAMRAPLDYVVVAALGLLNFVLSFVGYWCAARQSFRRDLLRARRRRVFAESAHLRKHASAADSNCW